MIKKIVGISALGVSLSFGTAFADSDEGVVKADVLNVRSGPSTDNEVIGKLYENNTVKILESSNGWYKIQKNDGQTGWVSGEYITLKSNSGNDSSSKSSFKATVTASVLNVRSGPSTNDIVISKINTGTEVEVLEESNGWYKVKLKNGQVGWASAQYLSTNSMSDNQGSSNQDSSNEVNISKTGIVKADVLNIRSNPGTNNSIIGKLYNGESITVLSEQNNWYKIKKSNGQTGWVSAQYISINSTSDNQENSNDQQDFSNEVSISKTGIVKADVLNIRSNPGTNNSIIGKLYNGESITVLSEQNNWYKIKKSNGQIGWVSAQYISLNNDQQDSSNEATDENIDKADKVVALAEKQIGKPYVWGAEGPDSFDCSGLVYYVYKEAVGINLPRVSRDQYNVGTYISKENLKPGDLVFSSTNDAGTITHVGIYVGDNKMIHSPNSGKNVEKVDLSNNYWKNCYVGAKRVL